MSVLHPLQFQLRTDEGSHYLEATHPEHGVVGQMVWDAKSIKHVGAWPERQGVGTALWNEGHRMASEGLVPPPKHSADRSDKGDAWARSVGGRLPRRKNTYS